MKNMMVFILKLILLPFVVMTFALYGLAVLALVMYRFNRENTNSKLKSVYQADEVDRLSVSK